MTPVYMAVPTIGDGSPGPEETSLNLLELLQCFLQGANVSNWCTGMAQRTDLTRASLRALFMSHAFQVVKRPTTLSTRGCNCLTEGRHVVMGMPR